MSGTPDRTRESLDLRDVLRRHTCPACGHHVAVPFFDPGPQPLATLAWPATAQEAAAMPRLPHDFVRCVDCGHVYNARFDYADVPYSDKPNLMFNRGAVWTEHLAEVRRLLLDRLPYDPVVVEIGCGSGHLLKALAQERPAGRYVGFDPNARFDAADESIEVRAALFEPAVHLEELRPDLVVSRHVLEHLMNPLGFVQELAFAVSWHDAPVRLFIEVPCIDDVFAAGRTVDFFYEHNSHFTTTSLARLLTRCAGTVELVDTGYNREVVFGLATFVRAARHVAHAAEALDFRHRTAAHLTRLQRDLAALAASGARVAIWGGTGKAAAFINQLGLDRDRFPLVVDSDPLKVGTCVPGTGQEIRFRDELRERPADVILIATQWRALDIVLEMHRNAIPFRTVLLEHRGRLVDFFLDEHPYRPDAAVPAHDTRPTDVPRPHFLDDVLRGAERALLWHDSHGR